MHESHNPVYNDSLLGEIQALEWVQGQIQHLANEKYKEMILDAAETVLGFFWF
jgi:hypothetical protein